MYTLDGMVGCVILYSGDTNKLMTLADAKRIDGHNLVTFILFTRYICAVTSLCCFCCPLFCTLYVCRCIVLTPCSFAECCFHRTVMSLCFVDACCFDDLLLCTVCFRRWAFLTLRCIVACCSSHVVMPQYRSARVLLRTAGRPSLV